MRIPGARIHSISGGITGAQWYYYTIRHRFTARIISPIWSLGSRSRGWLARSYAPQGKRASLGLAQLLVYFTHARRKDSFAPPPPVEISASVADARRELNNDVIRAARVARFLWIYAVVVSFLEARLGGEKERENNDYLLIRGVDRRCYARG